MCMNVEYETVIPPHWGYGEKGLEGYVPGSAVLHIDMKVKQFWNVMNENDLTEDCQDKTFTDCNQDDDKEINEKEFSSCFESCRIQGEPYKTHNEAINNVFGRLDLDKDSKLSENEFSVTFHEIIHKEL